MPTLCKSAEVLRPAWAALEQTSDLLAYRPERPGWSHTRWPWPPSTHLMHLTLGGHRPVRWGRWQEGLPGHEWRGWSWSCVNPCAHMRPPEALRPGHTGWPSGHREHIAMKGLVLLTVLAAGMWPKGLVSGPGQCHCVGLCFPPPFPLPRRERPPPPWPHLDAESGGPGPSPPQVGFMQLFHRLDSEARGCRAHGSKALACAGPCLCGCAQMAGEVFRDRCVLAGPGSLLEALRQGRSWLRASEGTKEEGRQTLGVPACLGPHARAGLCASLQQGKRGKVKGSQGLLNT